MYKKIRKLHFIGIGGSGMSGIAEILLNLGYDISGSDLAESRTIERLKVLGAVTLKKAMPPEHAAGADAVVSFGGGLLAQPGIDGGAPSAHSGGDAC